MLAVLQSVHFEGFILRILRYKLTKLSLCLILVAEYDNLVLDFAVQAHCSKDLSVKHTMRIKSARLYVVRHGSDPVVSSLGHNSNKAYLGSDR